MSNNNGYIPLHREELIAHIFQDRKRFCWWLWLRANAVYKACTMYVGNTGRKVQLNPAELATPKQQIACNLGVDVKTLREFLKDLVAEGLITLRKEKGSDIICIRPDFVLATASRTDWAVNGDGAWVQASEIPTGLPAQFPTQTSAETTTQLSAQFPTQTTDGTTAETATQLPSQSPVQFPTHPADTYIIKNIEEAKNFSLDIPAREMKFVEEVRESESTLELMAYNLKPAGGAEELKEMLEQFHKHCLSIDSYHESLSAFKKHFTNWARIALRENNKPKIKSNYNEQRIHTSKTDQRGVGETVRTAADYHSSIPSQLSNREA